MPDRVTPTVVVSKCLGFAACRYNGQSVPDHFVDQLKPHVRFVPVCPEMEVGLGVPRSPVHIISVDGELRLMQPETGAEVSESMLKLPTPSCPP